MYIRSCARFLSECIHIIDHSHIISTYVHIHLHAHMCRLEEKAQMKEDALKKSEMMLEEDAMRFDAFLKEHDRKAHDALKE